MRHRLRFLAAAAVLVPLAAAAPRLNVLFIASDDMRPQLGLYGDPVVRSPNLDRLAARGLAFDRAFCQMALCSPSRISLLSGRRPATTQVYTIDPALTVRTHLPDITTLPQHFRNEGYYTRSLGKIYHVGIDDPASWSEAPWHAGRAAPRLGPIGRAAQQQRTSAAKLSKQPLPAKGAGSAAYASPAFEAVECGDDELLDGACAREAVAQIRAFARQPGQPFFLAVGFANPHVPWVAPRKYFDLYDPAKLVLPANNFPPRGAPEYAAQTGNDFLWYAGVPQARRCRPTSAASACTRTWPRSATSTRRSGGCSTPSRRPAWPGTPSSCSGATMGTTWASTRGGAESTTTTAGPRARRC